MGAWGSGLFDNDLGGDVRTTFEEALADGLSPSEAAQRVLAEFEAPLQDLDEEPVVYFALASLLLERGALPASLRQKTLELLEQGRGLEGWQGKDLAERKAVLAEFRAKLL